MTDSKTINHFSFLLDITSVCFCVSYEITPEKINNLPPIISISAGSNFSLFLDANGSVWSCGYNASGQSGLGDNNKHRNIPEQITNLQ
jgi:alpha-tubulin suppressor-like RCC1 family protein